ncbi:MAG TPA: hypothetical protein VIL55_08865 [Naasia sp.]|jgi:hypothetical protein
MPDTTSTTDSGRDDQESRPGDGSIPSGPTGVGIGSGEATTFEPEEDPEAAAQRDGPDAGSDGAASDGAASD